jgi:hypothetical protein
MLGRVIAFMSLVAVLVLGILLQTTTPATIGPLGILIVFILMYVSALGVLTFLLHEGSRLIVRGSRSLTVRRPLQSLSLRRAYYYSSVVALAPVMFIGMQSVGSVGVYEVSLVVLFVTIACIYISKRSH